VETDETCRFGGKSSVFATHGGKLLLRGGAFMADSVYTSHVRIERVKGPIRQAFVEPFAEPIRFGVHGAIKQFYGVEPDEEIPATLDYMIAAIGG